MALRALDCRFDLQLHRWRRVEVSGIERPLARSRYTLTHMEDDCLVIIGVYRSCCGGRGCAGLSVGIPMAAPPPENGTLDGTPLAGGGRPTAASGYPTAMGLHPTGDGGGGWGLLLDGPVLRSSPPLCPDLLGTQCRARHPVCNTDGDGDGGSTPFQPSARAGGAVCAGRWKEVPFSRR